MADVGWKRAAIDISTATTTTIITAASDEYFEVYKWFLHSSGTQAVTPKSEATVICGKLDMVAQERFFLESANEVPLFRGTTVGDDFKLTTTQAVQISGFVVYKLAKGG